MKFPRPPAAAIFDFDETIIDLEPQHTRADAGLCEHFGDNYALLPESIRNSSGLRIIDVIDFMKEFFGWTRPDEELFRLRQQLFDEECRSSTLRILLGVEATIRTLRADGVSLAITSSAVASSIRLILDRLELTDFFSLIVDGADVSQGKPDPAAYLLTATRLGVAASHCLVFEDSQIGVIAAKRAGMYCVGVHNQSAKIRQDLATADLELESMDDFLALWNDTTPLKQRH